jgi:hypothetical protein
MVAGSLADMDHHYGATEVGGGCMLHRMTIHRWCNRPDYDPWAALAVAVLNRAYVDATRPRQMYQRECNPVNLQREAKQFLDEWVKTDETRRG